MNKLYSITLLILATLIVACGETSDETRISRDGVAPEGYVPDGVTYTDMGEGRSKATLFDASGRIIAEGDAIDGLKEGVWITYNNKSLPETLTSYHHGKKQGISLTFDRNGVVASKAYYANDILDGEYLKYDRRALAERKNYNKGVLDGLYVTYYTNGKVQQEAPYSNGEMDGLAKWYNQDGELTIAYIYENGELADQNPTLSPSDSLPSN